MEGEGRVGCNGGVGDDCWPVGWPAGSPPVAHYYLREK